MFRNQVRAPCIRHTSNVNSPSAAFVAPCTSCTANDADDHPFPQYDTDVVTWSPQGRIHQIEYAMEAVKQGSAAVGLRVRFDATTAAHHHHHPLSNRVTHTPSWLPSSAPHPSCLPSSARSSRSTTTSASPSLASPPTVASSAATCATSALTTALCLNPPCQLAASSARWLTRHRSARSGPGSAPLAWVCLWVGSTPQGPASTTTAHQATCMSTKPWPWAHDHRYCCGFPGCCKLFVAVVSTQACVDNCSPPNTLHCISIHTSRPRPTWSGILSDFPACPWTTWSRRPCGLWQPV